MRFIKAKGFWLYCAALFILYFITAYNLPLNSWDDLNYSSHSIAGGEADISKLLPGNGPWPYVYNAVQLQWQEYQVWHGRLFTHIIYRLAIGLPSFFPYFLNALALFGIFFAAAWAMFPDFLKRKDLMPLGLIVFMCSLLLNTLFTPFFFNYPYYFSTIYSSAGASALLLIFFTIYFRIFTENPLQPKIWQIVLLGLAAGNSHETSAAGIPMMLIVFVILKARKIPLPPWFWWGGVAYLAGFSPLYIPKGSIREQTFFLNYAGGAEWEFLGNTYNWLALGWEKYIFTFIRHVFLTPKGGYPGWIPSTWYIHLLFFIFWGLNLKKTKSLWAESVLYPALLYIFSWGLVSVMMFSPMFHSNTLDQLRLVLYTALGSVLMYSFELFSWIEARKKLLPMLLALPFILGALFIPALIKPAAEFRQWKAKVEETAKNGEIYTGGSEEFHADIFGAVFFRFLTEPTLKKMK